MIPSFSTTERTERYSIAMTPTKHKGLSVEDVVNRRSTLMLLVYVIVAICGAICLSSLTGDLNGYLCPAARRHDAVAQLSVADKLRGFPVLYMLSMSSPTRSSEALKKLALAELQTVVIKGVDGRDEDSCNRQAVYDRTHFKTAGELGATIAHLNAIKAFHDHGPGEYAVIVEDDFSLDCVPYWRETWKVYFGRIPKAFSIVQLQVTFELPRPPPYLYASPLDREPNFWGAVVYMVSRQGAQEVLDKYLLPDGRWNLVVCSLYLIL